MWAQRGFESGNLGSESPHVLQNSVSPIVPASSVVVTLCNKLYEVVIAEGGLSSCQELWPFGVILILKKCSRNDI